MARALNATGVSPNGLTLGGLALGLLAVPAIAFGYFGVALVFILVNRLADGLDGALARVWTQQEKPTAPMAGFST